MGMWDIQRRHLLASGASFGSCSVVALSLIGSRGDRFSFGCRLMPTGRDNVRRRGALKGAALAGGRAVTSVAASVGVCGLLADGQRLTQQFGGMFGSATVS